MNIEVPDYVDAMVSYKPGKPIEEVQRELGLTDVVKLASNENPFGPAPSALDAVRKSLPEQHLYPDVAGHYLREKLAQMLGLEMQNIVLSSGSEGVMLAMMRGFLKPGAEVISAENTFLGFKVLTKSCGCRAVWVPMKDYGYDLDAILDRLTPQTRLVYVANPDNPTGSCLSYAAMQDFIDRIPENVLIAVDEAYFEFARKNPDYNTCLDIERPNLIVLRTFSKLHGLAGFRVGYGLGAASLIEILQKVRLPFEPSGAAQAAGLAALKDFDFIKQTLSNNDIQMDRLTGRLDQMGVTYIPSSTNFVTMLFDGPDRAGCIAQEMMKRGVILRHLTAFGFPHAVRISMGTPSEMDTLFRHLEPVLRECGAVS